jgi:pimeloyl-ACP methyl ester carboxylesterase
VLALARRLEAPPLVMGMSLGGRVALEAALRAPELFRGVVMIAPVLPPRKRPWSRQIARLISPKMAERIPVEKAWPWLKRQADRLEGEFDTEARHDWFARASKRAIYYISCPATRYAFVSAARELALDPAFGPDGVWTRMERLRLPSAFVWGDKDKFVPMGDLSHLAELLPDAFQVHVPCAGHFDNGPHFLCMEEGAIEAVRLVETAVRGSARAATRPDRARCIDCVAPADRRAADTI